MHLHSADFRLGLAIALVAVVDRRLDRLAGGRWPTRCRSNCAILPGEEIASILMTNSLASDASCIVTCKFATTKYDNNPQITCAKPVPAGKEVEMCRLTSGGDRMREADRGSRGLPETDQALNEKARDEPGLL